jgi:hypothetical protein
MSSLNEQKLLEFAATLADDGDAAFVRAIAHFIARLHALAQFYDATAQELSQPHRNYSNNFSNSHRSLN